MQLLLPDKISFDQIRKEVVKTGAMLLLIKQNHLGINLLPEYIDGICDYLVDKWVTLIDKDDVTIFFVTIFTIKPSDIFFICTI